MNNTENSTLDKVLSLVRTYYGLMEDYHNLINQAQQMEKYNPNLSYRRDALTWQSAETLGSHQKRISDLRKEAEDKKESLINLGEEIGELLPVKNYFIHIPSDDYNGFQVSYHPQGSFPKLVVRYNS